MTLKVKGSDMRPVGMCRNYNKNQIINEENKRKISLYPEIMSQMSVFLCVILIKRWISLDLFSV